MQIRNIFKKLSLWLGGIFVASLFTAVLVGLVRYSWISLADPVVLEAQHQAKLDYLEKVPNAQENAPNIVIVFFDDLGWGDLSSYGNQLIQTPNIDRIAEGGLRMTDFYSASPVCTPSRAALLTGRYPPRTMTDQHVFFPDKSVIGTTRKMMGLANELPKEEIAISEVLKKAGYRTGLIGKWHLGDREGYRPNDFGFDYFFGVQYSNDMYPLHLFENNEIVEEDLRQGNFLSSERDEFNPLPGKGVDQSQLTEKYTDEAIQFIEQSGDTPFLLYLAHSFPHVPHYASSKFAGNSAAGTYGDVVEDLDRSTGRLMKALGELNLDRETLFIITSDNGADYNGNPGPIRGRKGEILEGGQRVPMIIHWPGHVSQGQVSDELAMGTDIFPTLLSITGIEPPKDRIIDGKDLSSMWTGAAPSPHDYLYYFPTLGALPGAIRDKQFKLLANTGDTGRDREHLTRVIDNESHDVQNLHPDALKRLTASLEQMRQEVKNNPRGWLTTN